MDRRSSEPSLEQDPVTPRTPDSESVESAATVPPPTPSSLRTGDGSGVDAAAELPLWRLKDVFIEATTLDREIRMLRKKIDPKSRQELTRIIDFCRDRLAQANRSAAAASDTHSEGSAPTTTPDQVNICARSQLFFLTLRVFVFYKYMLKS